MTTSESQLELDLRRTSNFNRETHLKNYRLIQQTKLLSMVICFIIDSAYNERIKSYKNSKFDIVFE